MGPLRALAAAAALGVALSGCTPSGGGDGQGFVPGDGSYTRVEPGKREAPVVLSGTDLEGKALSTETMRGKPVVVNVWGSWCPPCRAEAPDLVAAATKLEGTAHFVGLDTRDADVAQGQAFQRTFSVPYPSLFDPDGTLLLRLRGQVPPNAIPTTLVLDAQGRVAARVVGQVQASTLEGIVADVAEGR